MKEFQGTPGPWHYDDELGGVYSKGGQFVCDVTDKNNANLIAAAPGCWRLCNGPFHWQR